MTPVSVQDRDQPSRRVCLGTIATAHGVRGLVKILCDAQDPHLLDGTLYVSETGGETIKLTMKNSMGKYWLAEVEGIADRDAALALRGTKLWIGRDQLPELESEDEFYFEDLVGLRAEDANGNPAGTVISVNTFGGSDALEIKPPRGESYFLLFNRENVSSVSIADGKIVIVPQ